MVFFTATAPTLGGYIQYYWDWRAVFFILLIYTSFILVFTWKFLPETNQHLNPEATKIKVILQNYYRLLTNKGFLGYSLCVSLAYAGLIAYITCAPFLLQNVVGLTSSQFGWLSFVVGGATCTSFIINSRIVMSMGVEKMLFLGNCLMLLGGIIMLSLGCLGFVNVVVIMLPVALFGVGAGLNFSNGFAGASHAFPKMLGSMGALFGCLQILSAAIASGLMAGLHVNNQIPLSMVFISLSVLSLLVWRFLAKE